MTQAELNREIAAKTGETVGTINQRGFGLQLNTLDDQSDRPPLLVDWDECDAARAMIHPLP